MSEGNANLDQDDKETLFEAWLAKWKEMNA